MGCIIIMMFYFLVWMFVCSCGRESIRNHVAVGTISSILEGILKIKIYFPSVLHAYTHFEALRDRLMLLIVFNVATTLLF